LRGNSQTIEGEFTDESGGIYRQVRGNTQALMKVIGANLGEIRGKPYGRVRGNPQALMMVIGTNLGENRGETLRTSEGESTGIDANFGENRGETLQR